MSLDNIQLPSIVLQDLFRNSLVDLNTNTIKTLDSTAESISFLGNNQKHITIIVKDKEVLYLKDEELNFLMGILAACKFSMADVALLNIAKTGTGSYKNIEEQLQAETVVLFGVELLQLQLPLQFPHYQIQKFNNQVYLSAPALHVIAADKAEKTKLWNCLKEIFSIG